MRTLELKKYFNSDFYIILITMANYGVSGKAEENEIKTFKKYILL